MLDYLSARKERTLSCLQDFLAGRAALIEAAGSWGPDVVDRLLDYSAGGKMIRGALVYLGYELAGGTESSRAAPIAAAMELTQSFLLIHDDIMDHDHRRRGKPSIHRQYTEIAWKRGYRGNSEHFGEAMGICSGDIAFFLACRLIAMAPVDARTYRALMNSFVDEVALVGVAQMHDVTNGVRLDEVDEAEIFQLYRYKTGRYTFSLPLILGATAGGGDAQLNDQLGALGEEIGIIFQIRDDEIGIFGSDDQIGKPVGSDISEDKKTLLRARLFAAAPAAERATLERLFGADSVTRHDIDYICALIDSLGVRAQLHREVAELAEAVHARIDRLFGAGATRATPPRPGSGEAVAVLRQLVDYNLTRDR